MPDMQRFKHWRLNFKRAVASASRNPAQAFVWVSQVENAKGLKDLHDSGTREPLDAKIATGLGTILVGDLSRQINVIEEGLAAQRKRLKGRQIAWVMYEHFRISDTEGAILEFRYLLAIELKRDNLNTLLNEWESCLIGLKTVPPQDILESLFRKQLERSESLKGMMTLLNMNVTHKWRGSFLRKVSSDAQDFP